LVTDESSTPTVIETFLNGVLVESASVFGNVFNTENFYGFTNSLFDEIKVTPETTQSGGGLIDNLQFTLSSGAPPDGTPIDVPEPISLALLSSGLIGVGLIRRRRR
jgi:hypothetical protein